MRAIWSNYNGPHALDACFQKIRRDITELTYFGEKRSSNWSKFVSKHKELNVSSSLIADLGEYSDFSESEEVTYLVQGVKTNDLDVPLNIISSNDLMRSNFEAAQQHVARAHPPTEKPYGE